MLDPNVTQVKVVEETENFGRFEIEPLERGYGQTVGNTLRRVLLSSLSGAAVSSVKINGAKHEYTTLAGVEEDLLNIVLNLKELRIRSFTSEKQTIYLNIKKAGEVKAVDLETGSDLEILNPELVIATLADSKNPLSMEITVETGVGYNTMEDRRQEIGLIPVDANFSPVERVNFEVGSARLGQVTDLDKLTIEIYTKTIKPSEALAQALDLYVVKLQEIRSQVQVEALVAVEEKAPKAVKKIAAKKTTTKKAKK